ncbi:MAG: hypothetical protein AAGD01_15595 [Acidobacteriota bacterium]
MSTHTISVTFDASDQSFTFDPTSVDVASGETASLVWNLSTTNGSGGKTATFNSPYITFDTSGTDPFGTPVTSNSDTTVTVSDDDTSSDDAGTFGYTVYVTYDGTNYDSDPQIVNKSPTGGP